MIPLFQDIVTIVELEAIDALSAKDVVCREWLKIEMANKLQMKEISWRQKSRAIWIKE